MDPEKIINKYYSQDFQRTKILINHSKKVALKALKIARKNKKLNLDLEFIEKSCLIHDIGIYLVEAPLIDCHGSLPYICHGYLGREIMDKENFPEYGLICERHIGVGLTLEEIKDRKLPLPLRDMIPLTNEEQIVCLADKFFSKRSEKEVSFNEVKKEIENHGISHKQRLIAMASKFNL